MTDFAIEVKNLYKNFKNKEILKNIDFSVPQGSIVGLLGPNGSGKTTMIRLMNGVIEPTHGEIRIFGKNPRIQGDDVRQWSGIVTESTNLYHELTALENLLFFSKLYNVDDLQRCEDLLRLFDMWEHRHERIGTFSTGMKKRVALAKALLQKPKILFLDEPTNGLDPEGIHMVLNHIQKINREEKVTIFLCSHVLQQLENICQQYIFIKEGQLIASGTQKFLEEKYIKQYYLRVETGATLDTESFLSFPYKKIEEFNYRFTLSDKKDISILLRELLKNSWVHSCTIENNDLNSLYFSVTNRRDNL